MLKHRTLLGLASVGLLLSACADQQQSKVVPADTSGQETVFTTGFNAMQSGDNLQARAAFDTGLRDLAQRSL